MPLIPKKKGVLPGTKHKPYQPLEGMPEAALTAGDEFASQVEKIESVESNEVQDILIRLIDGGAQNEFLTGAAVARAHALFKPNDPQFGGVGTFKEYIKFNPKIDIGYRKAMQLREIYQRLKELGVPWKAFGIGWTKVRVLLPVLTKENIPEWVEKANGMNSESLKAAVRDALDGGKLKAEGALSNVKTKNFKFDDDQLDIVDAALEKAKTVANTPDNAVAMELICQFYMGGGADWKQGLALALKATSDTVTLVGQVVSHLKELCPDLEILIKPKGEKKAG